MSTLRFKPTAYALSLTTGILYLICATFQLVLPTWAMYNLQLWSAIYPGFSWTLGGVILGLVETILYTLLVVAIFTPIYNTILRRSGHTASHAG